MRTLQTILLLLPMLTMAQTAPPKAPALTNEQRLTLVSSYQRALLSQQGAFQAQQKAQQDATNFYLSCASMVKELKHPEGTTCNVNVDTGEVTFVAPPPKKDEGKK